MLLYYRPDHSSPITDRVSRRGGRAVDCAGLENRKAERPREFESHPLRFHRRTSTRDRLHNGFT
jgi:hypothetical protein